MKLLGVLSCSAMILSCGVDRALADIVSFEPAADTTIFQNASGELGNGAGIFLWCGRTGSRGGSTVSRTLIRFDLSSIPAGSTINSAQLKLRLEQASPTGGTRTSTAHKLLLSWGEGPASASAGTGTAPGTGDATWNFRAFPVAPWTTPGGDFVAAPSASVAISTTTLSPSFLGPGMIADVQSWVASPATNFGWIIRGVENVDGTARKFSSREISVPASRPVLVVDFTPPAPCAADFNGAGGVTVQDIFDFLAAWFAGCTATGAPPCIRSADFNAVGGITVQDIFDYLAAWFTGC